MTGSVAVLSSLVDSFLDAAASIVTLTAVRYSMEPADHDHRFGHGKAEALAGLAQAAFICGSGVLLLIEAIRRLFDPWPVQAENIGIAVMIFSIVVTLALVAFQRHVVRRTRSIAIESDSLHYVGDIALNGSVIIVLGAHAVATSRVMCQGEWGTDSPRPVFVDEDRVEDAVRRCPVLEGSHGPCSSADLAEPSFAGAGGADLPSPGKGPAAEAGEQIVEIVAQGSDGPGADALPVVGEAAGGGERLWAGVRVHDGVDVGPDGLPVGAADPVEDVADPVRPTPLDGDAVPDDRQGGEQALAAIDARSSRSPRR